MAQAEQLTVEYLTEPLGIDAPAPRFYWRLSPPDRRGVRQSAYRIVVSCGDQSLWDSGKVPSDQTTHVPYGGASLAPRTRYRWSVTVWDEQDSCGEERSSWFETGLMNEPLAGEWIGAAHVPATGGLPGVPLLRRGFVLTKPVCRARIYATALGVYELHLNGSRVGNACFTPGWTVYEKRLQYQCFDVTHLLHEGENVVGALLGTGWYSGEITGFFHGGAGATDRKTALRLMMVIEHPDAGASIITTNGEWRSTPSPLLYSDIYMGESYDARKEIDGWCTAATSDSRWSPVEVMAPQHGTLVAQHNPMVCRHEQLTPASVRELTPGVWIVDFGQNIVGWVRLHVHAALPGSTVRIRHGERLNPDGSLYTANLRRARATAEYVCRGGAQEVWEPRFTFFGFQYIELTGYTGTPTRADLQGVVVHSAMEPSGDFTCSDRLVTKLYRNIVWGQRGNYLEAPTDCPQRDERLGWTGDAQVFCRTATYNFDIAPFFTKWLRDLGDSQYPDGRYPHVAPDIIRDGGAGASAWGDAAIICPWVMYSVYGDQQILREHYPAMQRWMSFQEHDGEGFIRNNAHFGDWLAIDAPTSGKLIATAFFAHTADLMGRIAAVLEKEEERRHYRELFEHICSAFRREFITPAGRLVSETQTACLLALHFGLLEPDQHEVVLRNLIEDIRGRDMKLSCGFVGSPYLNLVLSANNRHDIAYHLLHQTQWPSWLYAVTQGATTIWERWNGWTTEHGFADPGMNSFNHYAYGAIGEWLFRTVAGIDTLPGEGYKRMIIAPVPGGKLWYLRAQYRCLHGLIQVRWGIEHEQRLVLTITVPPNTTARIRVPSPRPAEVQEGGGPIEQAEGISDISREERALWCEAQPGEYSFSAPWEPYSPV